MRLSYTPISLVNIFLITFLTLFLKPEAKAQSVLAVNFPHHHFARAQNLVAAADSDLIHSEFIPENRDEVMPAVDYAVKVNFLHTSVPYPSIKNPGRVYTGYHPLLVRIYSTSIQNRMRVTLKCFKVVVVPLWYARGSKN